MLSVAASLLVAGATTPALADPEPAPKSTNATTPKATTFPRPNDPDAPLRAAVEEAKKQNKPVAVEAAYTETSRTWAYPDGHLTSHNFGGPAQLKQPDGSWAWIDTSLVEQNGVLKPKLAKADVTFSLGGDSPFVTLERDTGQRLALSWPTVLPRPQVTGNVARYIDGAGKGADLVVTALPAGFRHDVILRERPAGPVEFRIPVATDKLTLATTKQDALKLTDDKGKTVLSAPTPMMWDAAADKPAADRPGRQVAVETAVETKDGATTLVLKPDAKWLADPATQYPVTVDPTTTLGVSQEVGIMSPSSRVAPGWLSRTHYKGCSGTGCTPVYKEEFRRSLVAFDTASIAGRQVVKATMQMALRDTVTNCSEFQGISARRITAAWTPDTTSWSSQPATTTEGRASVDPCSLPGSIGSWWSWDLTAMTRLWASGTPNYGLMLQLNQESPVPQNYGESFLFSPLVWGGNVPKLAVDWVLPPEIPTVTAESIDSLDGNDAIARSQNVKVTYKSAVPEATGLDYTVTVNDSTMGSPPVQLPTGEAGWWKLDETSGSTAADSSGKNVPAALSGAYSRAPGQLGQSVKFAGGYAATSKPVISTNQSFTAAAWVKLDNSSTEQTVFSQMGTYLPGFALNYRISSAPEYDQRWLFTMVNEDRSDGRIYETPIQSTNLAKIGEWTHVAAQYDQAAGKIRLFVDGVLAGERAYTASWNAQGAFEIGRGRVLGGNLNGSVDDVHVYQRVLTGDEIRTLVGVPGTTTHNNIPSGQALDKVFTLDNPASFKFVVKACRTGISPPSCNESPAYRITSDAPTLPTDTETGMADPTQPILSGMVNRPSGGPVTAKYYLYDNAGTPIGASPLGTRTVNGGERASFQIPANTLQAGTAYKWQMTACAVPQPQPSTTTRYEAEQATLSRTVVATTPTGYSGTGYADYDTVVGSYVEWTVNAPAAGNATLVFGYANGTNTTDRPVDITVNGTLAVDELKFPFTDTWATWKTVTATVPLKAGTNTIRATATTAMGGANIDYLDVIPQAAASGLEVCTSKTAPVSFSTPGTPPTDPVEDIRHLTLGKDSFVIKTAKTDPTACDGAPCKVTDDTVMRIGGTGVDKTAAVIGFKLDELPDGSVVTEAIVKFGTAACPAGPCPADAVITATPLKSAVTGESNGSDLAGDIDTGTPPYTLPLSGPQADIDGSEYQWLLLTSNRDEIITFADSAGAEQPSLALEYLPAGPPSKVVGLATQPGDASAIASWGLPESNGSVAMLDGYDVEVTNSSGAIVKTLAVQDPYAAITGLTNGETHTVKVRAKTAFGISAWEAASVSPKAVPPPPVQDVNQPCIPFLDGEQPQTQAVPAVSSAQAYLDRVKIYYQAQDAVLEGDAETIWDVPGVSASSPSTAKLSLLNAALVRERAELAEKGLVRTNSTVSLDSAVVQEVGNGSVWVTAKVTRDWSAGPVGATVKSSSPSRVGGPLGLIEPGEFTISVHAFDRCGNMTVIQVPIDLESENSDFYDPCMIQGHYPADPATPTEPICGDPSAQVEAAWMVSKNGVKRQCSLHTRQNYCSISQDMRRKHWHLYSSMVSTWNAPGENDHRDTFLKFWKIQRFEHFMYLYSSNAGEKKSTFAMELMKALKKTYPMGDKQVKPMEMLASACFRHNLASNDVQAGLTFGGQDTQVSVAVTQSYDQSDKCILRTENNWAAESHPNKVSDSANSATMWMECAATGFDSCNLDRFSHIYTGVLRVSFDMSKKDGDEYTWKTEHAYNCKVSRKPWLSLLRLTHEGCTVPEPKLL